MNTLNKSFKKSLPNFSSYLDLLPVKEYSYTLITHKLTFVYYIYHQQVCSATSGAFSSMGAPNHIDTSYYRNVLIQTYSLINTQYNRPPSIQEPSVPWGHALKQPHSLETHPIIQTLHKIIAFTTMGALTNIDIP